MPSISLLTRTGEVIYSIYTGTTVLASNIDAVIDIFAILSVTNKSSRAWVACNCVCFLNATNSGKTRIAAAIPDDDVTMRACKPDVTLARVGVYEIYARSISTD